MDRARDEFDELGLVEMVSGRQGFHNLGMTDAVFLDLPIKHGMQRYLELLY